MPQLITQLALWGAGRLAETYGPRLAVWALKQLPPVKRVLAAAAKVRP